MIIKCIASGSKGGTGKSTVVLTATRIARAMGIRVGVIDLAFGNPSTTLALMGHVPSHTLTTYLMGVSRAKETIQTAPTTKGPIYLVPSGYGDAKLMVNVRSSMERFDELVTVMNEDLRVELLFMDFPAFNPYMDKVIAAFLHYCDYTYPILVQDYGSLISTYELTKYCGERSIRLGRPVLNMVREPMGDGWGKSIGKLLGNEPFIIHYDPWIIRFTMYEELRDTQGIRELLSFVLRHLIY